MRVQGAVPVGTRHRRAPAWRIGSTALTTLGGVTAIGGANTAYLALATTFTAEVGGNLAEQGTLNALGTQSGLVQEDLMVSMILSVPMAASGFGLDPLKEEMKASAGDIIKQHVRSEFTKGERNALINSQAKEIKSNFAKEGMKVSGKQARIAAKKVVSSKQETKSSIVNATISVGEHGVTVGIATAEGTASDGMKDAMKREAQPQPK